MAAAESQRQGAAQLAKPPLLKVYSLQLALLCTLVGLSLLHSEQAAVSLLLGGLLALLPNAWFAWRVFRYRGASAAMAVTQSFYRGEAGKFVLTLFGFASVFVLWPAVVVPALFGGYLALALANTVGAAYISSRRQ